MEIEPGFVAVGVTVILAFLAAGMYVIRSEVMKGNRLVTVNHGELFPDHGTTMRDAVDRIEDQLRVVHLELRDLRLHHDSHLTYHLAGRDGN